MNKKTIKTTMYYRLKRDLDINDLDERVNIDELDELWFNPYLNLVVDIQNELEHDTAR